MFIGKEFIDRFLNTIPIKTAVIVNNKKTGRQKSWVEILKSTAGRRIKIAVQMNQTERAVRRHLRSAFGEMTFDKLNIVRSDIRAHDFYGCVAKFGGSKMCVDAYQIL